MAGTSKFTSSGNRTKPFLPLRDEWETFDCESVKQMHLRSDRSGGGLEDHLPSDKGTNKNDTSYTRLQTKTPGQLFVQPELIEHDDYDHSTDPPSPTEPRPCSAQSTLSLIPGKEKKRQHSRKASHFTLPKFLKKGNKVKPGASTGSKPLKCPPTPSAQSNTTAGYEELHYYAPSVKLQLIDLATITVQDCVPQSVSTKSYI